MIIKYVYESAHYILFVVSQKNIFHSDVKDHQDMEYLCRPTYYLYGSLVCSHRSGTRIKVTTSGRCCLMILKLRQMSSQTGCVEINHAHIRLSTRKFHDHSNFRLDRLCIESHINITKDPYS